MDSVIFLCTAEVYAYTYTHAQEKQVCALTFVYYYLEHGNMYLFLMHHCHNYVARFGIVHTNDFAHLKVHKN